jgi:glycerol 2-dehydrogenase (NADP+)
MRHKCVVVFVLFALSDYDHDDPQRGLEKSLKELNIEYIDLYLMHWPMARLGSMDGKAIVNNFLLVSSAVIYILGKVYQPDESPTFIETWLAMEKLLDTGFACPL